MPQYKYFCPQCHNESESIEPIGSEYITCSVCGYTRAFRIFTAENGIFKKGEGYWADGK